MTQDTNSMLEAAGDVPGANSDSRHGSWQGYLVGYVTAIVLTGAAFAVVKGGFMSPSSAVAAVTVLAIGQMLVHLIFFLHIDTAPGQRTNILAFIVTAVIIVLIVAGSLWIMAHLQSNMMPMGQLMQMQR